MSDKEGLMQFLAKEDTRLRKVEEGLNEALTRIVQYQHSECIKRCCRLECVSANISLMNMARDHRKLFERIGTELRKLKSHL